MPNRKHRRTTKMKTELGLEITVTQSHKLAETTALAREEADVLKTRYQKREAELMAQMKEDGLTSVTARTAGGSVYEFTVEDRGEKVKVKRITEKNIEKVAAGD